MAAMGDRGRRTQQRILDAALRVFGEDGYRRPGIARIAAEAGCSRASFYQYFTSKEDVFRHLAGQVARQLTASAEALPTLAPDAAGWTALRGWVTRHADIYARYEPVFRVHDTASEADEDFASSSRRAADQIMAMFGSRLTDPPLPPRQLQPLLRLLLKCVSSTQEFAAHLAEVAPADYDRERVEVAITDVVHRILFGRIDDVNVRAPGHRPTPIPFGTEAREALAEEPTPPDLTRAALRTHDALLDAGRTVLVRQGFDATRVDDVVDAAGMSHGAFYRHFRNKEHLAQVLAWRAMRTVSTSLDGFPGGEEDGAAGGRSDIRAWIRRYNTTASVEAAILQVWVDASFQDRSLRPATASSLDWGRRRLVEQLSPRDFGDVEIDAIFALALLASLGTHRMTSTELDAAAFLVGRGLLGQPHM